MLPAHQWKQHHHNKGNNASLTMSNKSDTIDDENNAIAMRAMMLA